MVTPDALLRSPLSTSDVTPAGTGSARSTPAPASIATDVQTNHKKTLFRWKEVVGDNPAFLIVLTVSLPLLL